METVMVMAVVSVHMAVTTTGPADGTMITAAMTGSNQGDAVQTETKTRTLTTT